MVQIQHIERYDRLMYVVMVVFVCMCDVDDAGGFVVIVVSLL